MKKVKLLELSKKGMDFSYVVPKDTSVAHVTQALALFIIDSAKYRGIKTSTALAEIQHWVKQLEDNL